MAETSLMAYLELEPRIPTIHGRIIDVMWEAQYRDWTSREIATELKEYGGTISPRLRELERRGLVRITQIRPCSVTGHKAQAWGLI